MPKMLLVLSILLLSRTGFPLPISPAPEQTTVSIFDVRKETVARTMPLTPRLARYVVDALEDSPSTYLGFTLDPKDGWIVHVSFPAPATARSPFYVDKIKETYLFLESGTNVRALIFYDSVRKISIAELKVSPERLAQAFEIRLPVRPSPLQDQDDDQDENGDAERIHDPRRIPNLQQAFFIDLL